jgi:putative DNA primase/helicase
VREEAAGILAWLAEGVLDFLANGFFIAESVRASTAEYREEMDPVGEFLRACVAPLAGQRVQAGSMFEAYTAWSEVNGRKAVSQTKFGRVVSQHFQKTEYCGRIYYLECDLHDVPARQARNPEFGTPEDEPSRWR